MTSLGSGGEAGGVTDADRDDAALQVRPGAAVAGSYGGGTTTDDDDDVDADADAADDEMGAQEDALDEEEEPELDPSVE